MPPTRFLGAIVALACVFASSAAAQAPKHMLFRATGPNGATVYLLGSVHLLTADAATLPAEVDTAFAHAKTIVFETNLDTMMLRAQELLAHARYPSGVTLRSSLSPAAAAKLDTLLRAYGLTVDQVNGFKPWFVSIVMLAQAMQRAHFEQQYGVDDQLNVRAHTAGKTIVGLEPVDFQLAMFDSISPADQERMVFENGTPDSLAVELTTIKNAWIAGDAARLDSVVNKRSPGDEQLRDLLVTKRNRNWLPKIESLLQGKDDVLVVVGAAHLIGGQGVLGLLRAKGYKVVQL